MSGSVVAATAKRSRLSIDTFRVSTATLHALLGFAALRALWLLWSGRDASIFVLHGMRQTQTAWAIRTIARGGPVLRYETPIWGPPWSMPLEFPLYQWLSAQLVVYAGCSVETAGRLVSAAFLGLCVPAIVLIQRATRRTPFETKAAIALTLVSPVLVQWGRSVSIETTIAAIVLWWVAFALRASERPSAGNAIGVAVLGVLAGIVKPTAVLPGAVFLGVLLLVRRGSRSRAQYLRLVARLGLLLAPSALGAAAWSAWTDQWKEQSPNGAVFASAGQRQQLFGSSAERADVVGHVAQLIRTFDLSVGVLGVLAVVFALAVTVIVERRSGPGAERIGRVASPDGPWTGLAGLTAVGLTILTFVHVHRAHDYYAVEVAVFAVLFVCAGIAGIGRRLEIGRVVLLVVVFASALWSSMIRYGGVASAADPYPDELRTIVQRVVGPDDVVVLDVGTWDHRIGYFVDRRSQLLRATSPGNDLAGQISAANNDGHRIAGLVTSEPPPADTAVALRVNGFRREAVVGGYGIYRTG